MTNPTKAELITLYTNMINAKVTTTGTGPVSDADIDAVANGGIATIDNLDPDRPVRIRQVERV